MKLSILTRYFLVFLSCTCFIHFSFHRSVSLFSMEETQYQAQKELEQEHIWYILGAKQSLYTSKIDGSELQMIYDEVGTKDSSILNMDCSEDGKLLFVQTMETTHRTTYSLWLINLENGEQKNITSHRSIMNFYTQISGDGRYLLWLENKKRILYYDTFTKEEHLIGATLFDVASPSFSPDSKSIVFVGKDQRQESWNLWIHEINSAKESKLSTENEGTFRNPQFFGSNQSILSPRNPEGKWLHSLWSFDLISKKYHLIADLNKNPNDPFSYDWAWNILGCDLSHDGQVIIFYTNYQAYSILESDVIPLSEHHHNSTIFYSSCEPKGKYALIGTNLSPAQLVKTDGSYQEQVNSRYPFSIQNAINWYPHPPHPASLSIKLMEAGNMLHWEAPRRGSNEIVGLNIYRSIDKEQSFELIKTVASDSLNFLDNSADLSKNYYYMVKVVDQKGMESFASNSVLADRIPPHIQIITPLENSWHHTPKVSIFGIAKDEGAGVQKVVFDGEIVELDKEGKFQFDYYFKNEGSNEISIIAYDHADNKTQKLFELRLDTIAPTIEILYPQQNSELYALNTYARGKILDQGSGVAQVWMDGQEVILKEDGTMYHPTKVQKGENLRLISAIDHAGNRTDFHLSFIGVETVYVILQIGSNTIQVNGKSSFIDAPPMIHKESGRTLVPARFVVEPIGGRIDFFEKENKIQILRQHTFITLWIGKNKALVNGKEVAVDEILSLTPLIHLSRTFLPLRFVAENLGFYVAWDPAKQLIHLKFP
jgi:Tol biopolymer transport system component